VAVWSQEDIDALKEAVKSGVLSVEYAGPPARRITYQSLAQMRDLLAEMVAEVQTTAGSGKKVRLAKFRSGLNE
jgi:hypothetical protein